MVIWLAKIYIKMLNGAGHWLAAAVSHWPVCPACKKRSWIYSVLVICNCSVIFLPSSLLCYHCRTEDAGLRGSGVGWFPNIPQTSPGTLLVWSCDTMFWQLPSVCPCFLPRHSLPSGSMIESCDCKKNGDACPCPLLPDGLNVLVAWWSISSWSRKQITFIMQ